MLEPSHFLSWTDNIYYEKCFNEEAYDYNEKCTIYTEFDFIRHNYDATVYEMCDNNDAYKITYRCEHDDYYDTAETLQFLSILFVCWYGILSILIPLIVAIKN